MKRLIATAACGMLAGCAAVPIQVTLFTQAADGVSYLESGKSITDHLLSAMLDRDCAVLRVLDDEAICTGKKAKPGDDNAPAPTQVADNAEIGDPMPVPADIATPLAEPGGVARSSDAQPAPIVAAFNSQMFFAPAEREPTASKPRSEQKARKTAPETTPGDALAPEGRSAMAPVPDVEPAAGPMTGWPEVRDLRPAPVAQPQSALGAAIGRASAAQPSRGAAGAKPAAGRHYFVVVGSFSRKANADRTARREGRGARVVPGMAKGREVWRVVVGPFDRGGARAQRDWLRSAGGSRSAWVIRSCAVASGPCIDAAAMAR